MKNIVQQKRTMQRDMDLFSRIRSFMEQERYSDAKGLIEERLKDEIEMTMTNREFHYLKAVVADNMGDPVTACGVFLALRQKFPKYPKYFDSTMVNYERLAGHVGTLINNDPHDPIIRKCYSLFADYWYPPFWLSVAMSRLDVHEGRIAPCPLVSQPYVNIYV